MSKVRNAMLAGLFSTLCACAASHSEAPTRAMKSNPEIVLPAPSTQEGAALRKGGKDEPHQVGFGRTIPPAQQRIALSELQWVAAPGGGSRARITMRSTSARSMRVGIAIESPPAGLKLGFKEPNGKPTTVDASVAAQANVNAPYWSPVISGDTVHIELTASSKPSSGALHVLLVSHIP